MHGQVEIYPRPVYSYQSTYSFSFILYATIQNYSYNRTCHSKTNLKQRQARTNKNKIDSKLMVDDFVVIKGTVKEK